MKKNTKVFASFISACLVVAAMAIFQPKTLACSVDNATTEDGKAVTDCLDIEHVDTEIKKTTDITYFSTESELKSEEQSDHSLFLAGNRVESSDEVNGIGFLAGNLVEVDGIYSYGLFAGNSIKVSGEIKNDLFIAGNAIVIDEDAIVSRDLFAVGNTVNISANLYGNVFAGGNRLVLDNVTIDGDLNVDFDQIVIKGKSSIAGNFKYNENATITGLDELSFGSIETFVSRSEKTVSFFTRFINKLISLLGQLVLVAVFILIFGKHIDKALEEFKEKDIFKNALIGLGILFLVPTIAIFVAITIIGMPVAITFLLFWGVALILSVPIAGIVLGDRLARNVFKKAKMNLYVKALLGVTVVELLSLIPFVGALVSIMSVLFGLGFILTSSTKKK